MLCEFTVYDDDNFDPNDQFQDSEDNATFDNDYLENYVCKPDKEYMYRCQKAITKLKHSLREKGIGLDALDNLFKEGLKVLFASCFVDQYLNLDTTSF